MKLNLNEQTSSLDTEFKTCVNYNEEKELTTSFPQLAKLFKRDVLEKYTKAENNIYFSLECLELRVNQNQASILVTILVPR